ncbi:MAG TPA: 1-deoxy-D-xylulose-5-phosphate reductoisomerase [Peptococcaceae bacterium]|nr:MAG: 1-deoxy-D-xylulose 5-phosphate reductoisomerase [Moorella sp. 60_41]HBT47788.1 1-deoxy-D-xylulose-5-phosphate reductoisomerase [Peptococcaceae bacterium]
MSKGIVILGSTGSIGRQALEVIENFPDGFRVLALAAARNIERLEEQIRRHRPRVAVVLEEVKQRELRERVGGLGVEVLAGPEGLLAAATLPEADLVLAAMVGTTSLPAVLAAIEAGKNIALANKEILVTAGDLVMEEVRRRDVCILPVDSEHSAVFQCLRPGEGIHKVILTASGGPFRKLSLKEMERVTPEMALAHPNWQMGPRVTVDSATLMNKGLEVIEAKHLFRLDYRDIEVIIHPQSIVHAIVTYNDGSSLAHMSLPDMRLPIQYALTWPERWANAYPRLDLTVLGSLTFEEPDWDRFPCLGLALEAGRQGATFPAVLNAADEVAVDLFLQRKIGFLDIPRLVEGVLARHRPAKAPGLQDILAADRWARRETLSLAAGRKGRCKLA